MVLPPQRHRGSEQSVVREHEIGRKLSFQRAGVGLYEVISLRGGQLLQQARLEIPIAVHHEYRQDSADLGPHDPRRSEIEPPGVRVLAEDDDLVTHPTPEAGERASVDVGSGAAEQIAVPQENLQGASPACGSHRPG